jgi:hypothetical protein
MEARLMFENPKAEEVLNDIRADMIDSEIMRKHQVSAKELRGIYRELFEAKTVDISELYCRPIYWDDNIDLEPRREFPRLLLAFVLPIHDVQQPNIRGIVADVTEKGMRLAGMEATAGESRNSTPLSLKLNAVGARPKVRMADQLQVSK